MIDQEIYGLMDRFDRSGLGSLKLSTGKFTLELSKATSSLPAPQQEAPCAPCDDPVVTAPLVGTFYAAPAPDQPPYVSVGDQVQAGQTLCLLEAMKMMSEITAPCDCVIEAVLKENGALAAYGEPLFRYRVC